MANNLENYTKLNNSFKKKLVFRIGINSGFFSEYNNMILAMLYCLENKIKFTLYSKNANFGYKNGWTDYFLPFCEENDDEFHAKYNLRWIRGVFNIKKLNPIFPIYHLKHRHTFLTFEVWKSFRSKHFKQTHFYVPELGIDGDLAHACHVLVDLTWRYNAATDKKITNLIDSLHLPTNYIGFHIRSGDKITETELIAPAKYLELAEKNSQLENAFVLTDDYQIIEEVQLVKNVYTLCGKEERGYVHKDFEKKDKTAIRQAHERLFASIEILSRADISIGTYLSNVGIFLGMRMPAGKMFGVDLDKWQI
jgi:hypothetical protein